MRTELRRILLISAMLGGSAICWATDSLSGGGQAPPAATSNLYLKVQLDKSLKLSQLKPGDVVTGVLERDVYSSDRELFATGSPVRLSVERTERRRRTYDDHWPWVVKAFTPRHQNYPVFATAAISGASGEQVLQVSLISTSRRREVHAQAKKKGAGLQAGNIEVSQANAARPQKTVGPTMIFEAAEIEKQESPSTGASSTSGPAVWETLPAGTACKILLLTDVSASRNKPGDVVQARLIEPVRLNSRVVLSAGAMFEGKVVKKTSPRWGSRAGSLALEFAELTLPGGNRIAVATSLTGAELDRRSHTRIDAEGQLHGEHPGRAWMAINIGVTAGLAKEADDTTQLIIEAIVSTATDASTAGTARIVATCISSIFMVSRHGRDVVLPRFTEMDLALDRPLAVPENAESAISPNNH